MKKIGSNLMRLGSLIFKCIVVMKISIILLLTFTFQAAAYNGYSQERINLSLENATIPYIFKMIENTSDYRFIYGDNIIGSELRVSIHVKNATLDYTMQKVLQKTDFAYKIVDKNLVVVMKGKQKLSNTSPQRILRGRVLDEEEKPVEAATVSLRNTRKTTLTDSRGEFTIEVESEDDELIVSHVGYKTKTLPVGGQQEIVIMLEPDAAGREMNEVVITAYGIQKQRRSLGYAAQVVDGSKLTLARETNVANSLKGQVAGVYVNPSNTGPAGSVYIDIRGVSSLKGNNQPLYVIDGVPIDNQTIGAPDMFNDMGKDRDYGDGIGNILPDDIESITVLKGPNAASLYGSRGANGVIVISTKKGKSGRATISFNSNYTIETPNVLPRYQQVWGSGYNNDLDYAFPETTTINGETISVLNYDTYDNWGGKLDGRKYIFHPWVWTNSPVMTLQSAGQDNRRKFYENGFTATNTLAISGGSDKGNYRFSVSDLRNEGIFPNSSIKRQTYSVRAGLNATEKLYVEGKINYIRQKGKNRPGNGLDINAAQFALTRVPNFVPLDTLKKYYKTEQGYSNNYNSGRPFNPYWVLNEFLSNDSRDRVIGYMLSKYQFTNWLSLQARGGTDIYTDQRFSRIGMNTPTWYNNLGQGEVYTNTIQIREDNVDVLLSADGKLSDKFTGNFSAGANHLNRKEEILAAEGFNLNIYGIYNIFNASLVYPQNTTTRKQLNSVYFSGQLGYNDYLYLDVNGRNDWSSTLYPGDVSFMYGSASASFIFTDAFKLQSDILSFGKLRASYGSAGNDAAPYQTMIGYGLAPSSYNGQRMISIASVVPNTNLKNELKTSFEIGTELRMFDNRLNLDFSYYNANSKNQILDADLSAGTGFLSRVINAGVINNKGIELLINAVPLKAKDFIWQTTINFSRNRSVVKELAPDLGINNIYLISGGGVGTIGIEARAGELYGNIVGYKYKRAPDGQKLLSNEGTFQREDTTAILGNIQPDFLAGFTNTFSYKGFTLSGLIDIRKGGQVFSNSKAMQFNAGTSILTENGDNLIADGVIQAADGSYQKNTKVVGRMQYYTAMSWGDIAEEFVLPADYVSLRELTFGYDIGRLFNKSVFRTLKLSLVGRNLLYLYRHPQFKAMGISPESAYGPFTVAQGYESPGGPTTRSLGVNLGITF